MLPIFANLLPGLVTAGSKFLKNTAADILAGKNVLQSAKDNAITAANEIIPGAGGVLEKGIEAVGKFIKGRKIAAPTESVRELQKKQAAAGYLKSMREIRMKADASGELPVKSAGLAVAFMNGLMTRGTSADKAAGAKIVRKLKKDFPTEMAAGKKKAEEMAAEQAAMAD